MVWDGKAGSREEKRMNYRRFMAFLLTGVLVAGLAAAPVRVRAEENGDKPEEEIVLGEAGETAESEKPEKIKKEDPAEETQEEISGEPAEAVLLAAPSGEEEEDSEDEGFYIYDTPSDIEMVEGSEQKIYVGDLSAEYNGPDGKTRDYPLSVTGVSSLEPETAEVVLEDKYILIRGKSTGSTLVTVTYDGPEGKGDTCFYVIVYEIYEAAMSDVDDVSVLEGGEHSEDVSVWLNVQNEEHPSGDSIDCEVVGAGVEDSSVAEADCKDGVLTVKGIKSGTTKGWISYIHPDGDMRQYPFDITVSEVLYDVYLEDSFEELEMLAGDKADLKIKVYREDNLDYTEVDDGELEVHWYLEDGDSEEPPADFYLEADGTSATLSVIEESGGDVDVKVIAVVFLKETGSEIGTAQVLHSHPQSSETFIAEDTLPDGDVEVGDSFTITPYVLKRQETGDGKTISWHEKEAVVGLFFDPDSVRVTDQYGREVEPAEEDEEGFIWAGQEDGVVYTVTRLTEEEISITAAGAWPGSDDSMSESYQRYSWTYFYLGSLKEEENSDTEDQPVSGGQSGQEEKPASAGKDASSKGNSGRAETSSKTGKTSGKTATGDMSDWKLWSLLAASSLLVCIQAAGALRKKTR